MSTFRLASALSLALVVAGCGDDTSGTGGGGGEGTTASATTTTTSAATTAAVTGVTSSTTSGGEGGSGEGGGGEGGSGDGGTSACVGELADAYDGEGFADDAEVELALRAQLGALNAAMAAAETDPEGDLVVTADELIVLFEAGDPSLADSITAYYDGVVRDAFVDYEAASGDVWTPAEPPVAPGGHYAADIFDETGRDLRQWVEKGHFNSLFYGHAVGLVEGGLDAAGVHQLLATYGAHPDFPGDSSADTATNPDRLAAQYAERRSAKDPEDASAPLDPEAPGIYFQVKNDFILLQAAVESGCDAERDAAGARILAAWERDIIAGTVVYYMSSAIGLLTSDTATEEDLAAGLHQVGEATAFLHGFIQSPAEHRVITDEEIEGLLELLENPYQLVLAPADEAPRFLDVVDGLATIYGFTEAELEAFETNH